MSAYDQLPLIPTEDDDGMPEVPEHEMYRPTDPETSKRGAHDVHFRAGSQKRALLGEYAMSVNGLTDEEAARRAGLYDPTICYWKRCSELRGIGFITPTGDVRLGAAGSEREVCVITPLGRDAHNRMSRKDGI